MSSKICIIINLKIIIILIKTIFLLWYTSHPFRWRSLTPTRTWSMLCTYLRISKPYYHCITTRIIPKLTWCIHSFLNIYILTWKLFNFSFYYILHEMFRLSNTLILHTLIHFILSWLKIKLILLITMGSNYTSIGQLWRWLQTNTRLLSTVIKRSRIHFIVILCLGARWVILKSLCASTIQ